MKVRRLQAMELENGALQVSIVIKPEDRAEFFRIAPGPGSQFRLTEVEQAAAPVVQQPPNAAGTPFVKPPTQTIAPAGKEQGSVGTPREAGEARKLCDSPYFQAYAAAQLAPTGEYDARDLAQKFLLGRVLQGRIWDSEATNRYLGLVAEFKAWCDTKGYK